MAVRGFMRVTASTTMFSVFLLAGLHDYIAELKLALRNVDIGQTSLILSLLFTTVAITLEW